MSDWMNWLIGDSANSKSRRKQLRFERLENRRMLAADWGAIAGTVFSDLDNDGLFEPSAGESGIAGVAISLSGTDVNGPVVRPNAVTGADGSYRFDNLKAGSYVVTQLPPAPAGVLPSSSAGSVAVTITPQAAVGAQGRVIDAFDGVPQVLTAVSPGQSNPMVDSVVDPAALGGTRDLTVEITSGAGIATVATNAGYLPGVLDINPGFSSAGKYVVTWDGDTDPNALDATGLGGIDLTSGGAMHGLTMLLGVDKSNETVALRIYSDSGNWSEATIALPNTGGAPTQHVMVPWSAFTAQAGAGADMSNVGALQLEVDASVRAMDGQIDLLAAVGPSVQTANFANIPASPGIDIEKSTNGEDADTGTGPMINLGGLVAWEYQVRNTGNTALGGVVVRDDNGTPGNTADDFSPTFVSGDADSDSLLDTNEVWIYSATATASTGEYVNLGDVTGNPVAENGADIPSLSDVVDSDPSRYYGVSAAIDIEKAVNGDDADSPVGPYVPQNGDVTFTYVVTNTGNVALGDVEVTADVPMAITFVSGDDDGDGLLDTNEVWTYTSQGVAQPGQQQCAGAVVGNPVQDNGADIAGLANVTDTDPIHYFGAVSEIHLEKSTNGEDADDPTGPQIPSGSQVTFQYIVTNSGNQPLANVVLRDDAGTPNDPSDDATPTFLGGDDNGDGLLDTDEAWLYEWLATAVVGQYQNRAVVAADDIFGESVSDDDLSHYLGLEPITPNNIPPGFPNKRRFLSSRR